MLLNDLDKPVTSCANKKHEKKEEDNQNAMPDSTTNTEKTITNPFHCGDDVLVPNKDGRYYLGIIMYIFYVTKCRNFKIVTSVHFW